MGQEQGGSARWPAHRVTVHLHAVGDGRVLLRPRGPERRALQHRDQRCLGVEGGVHQRHRRPADPHPGRQRVRRGELRHRAGRERQDGPAGQARLRHLEQRDELQDLHRHVRHRRQRGDLVHLRRPEPDSVPIPQGAGEHSDDNADHRRAELAARPLHAWCPCPQDRRVDAGQPDPLREPHHNKAAVLDLDHGRRPDVRQRRVHRWVVLGDAVARGRAHHTDGHPGQPVHAQRRLLPPVHQRER